jgi:predicted nucleic acid-binding protein
MIILVADTSVLIDLERGGLLEPAFSCALTMVVPDLLYARELEAENGPLLRRLGLGVIALVPDEVAFAQELRKQQPGLSLPDCFALSCARRPNHALVTGDKLLRTVALSRQCTVHGLLWILDLMESSGKVGTTLLHEGLTRISNHPRCRLPHGEVRARLERWLPPT